MVLSIEADRLKRKGLINNLIGWSLLAVIYGVIPRIVREFWPENIEDTFSFYVFYSTMIIIVGTFTYCTFFAPGIYLVIKVILDSLKVSMRSIGLTNILLGRGNGKTGNKLSGGPSKF